MLTFQGRDFILQLQDLVLVVLIRLLDVLLILLHVFLELSFVMQILGLLGELLHVGHHNIYVQVFIAPLALVKLFGNKCRVPLPSIGTVVPRVCARALDLMMLAVVVVVGLLLLHIPKRASVLV